MIDNSIKEYIRIFNSVTLPQKEKDRIIGYLIEKTSDKKDMSGKYVFAASAVAFLAVGTYLLAKSSKQDINIM